MHTVQKTKYHFYKKMKQRYKIAWNSLNLYCDFEYIFFTMFSPTMCKISPCGFLRICFFLLVTKVMDHLYIPRNAIQFDLPDPRKFMRGIGSPFHPCVNTMEGRPCWLSGMEVSYCTFGFCVIIRHDLHT